MQKYSRLKEKFNTLVMNDIATITRKQHIERIDKIEKKQTEENKAEAEEEEKSYQAAYLGCLLFCLSSVYLECVFIPFPVREGSVLFFQIKLKPVRTVSTDVNLNIFQHKVL